MAAGVNYNGVWGGLGKPVSVLDVHKQPFHIGGSDCAGHRLEDRVGGHAVEGGRRGRPSLQHDLRRVPRLQRLRPDGLRQPEDLGLRDALRQLRPVHASRRRSSSCPRAPNMTWEESASYALDLCTAYRMLVDRANLRPGRDGPRLGRRRAASGRSPARLRECSARLRSPWYRAPRRRRWPGSSERWGRLNRKDFPGLAWTPNETPERKKARLDAAKAFGKAFMKAAGSTRGPDVVFEHPGQETFPTSVFMAAKMGRIVICAATSGFDLHFDVRHLWMRQKQIIGSHFAHAEQCWRANDLVLKGTIKPCMTEVYSLQGHPAGARRHDAQPAHGQALVPGQRPARGSEDAIRARLTPPLQLSEAARRRSRP